MEKPYINTPEGTRDRLFNECRDRRSAQAAVTTLFKSRGYSEVVTPEVEYYDLFLRSGNPIAQESMLKIIDRSGKICVMRPDCTTPIARVAATKLASSPFPQRLYYNETVFRSDDAHVGAESEIAQCGIELIGAPGIRGDAEVIAMAIDALEACGLEQFHIELGHSDFFPAVAERLGLSDQTAEEIHRFVERKDAAGLRTYLDDLTPQPELNLLAKLPLLFGDVSVLETARLLAGDSGEAHEAIVYLEELYSMLSQAGRGHRVRFDLGLVTRLDYYTGVVFRGYAEGAGRNVLSGGRYDRLLGYFGQDRPATGFAVYMDDLAACLPSVKLPVVDTVIHFSTAQLQRAIDLVDSLPNGTAELSPWGDMESSRALAQEKQVKRLLVVDERGCQEVAL